MAVRCSAAAHTKSQRSGEDAAVPLRVGAANVLDRMAASVVELTAVEPVFQEVSDVPNGGVQLSPVNMLGDPASQ